ncbi:ATP-dependent DNA helicase [Arsenicicoccus bolidensis]|uniref:DNA 3'-5' helicase n=1 Tax=Arsenicicoccus bolidensis TaxID=229480 RepID=A0ABS9Q0R0_9MICO|nr:ATP-dependent DNA helicase [Arsenicicoccus bolidensis]MCG7321457.1 ATP-dependent helicase [Arsenicicoccus bolidensis]
MTLIGALDIARALGQPPPTAEQQAVIEAPREPLLVVAGAGSGKTETMSARVVWLVANGLVQPQEVLGLTFTRKAAGELAERIGRRLRQLEAAGLWRDGSRDDGLDLTPTVSTYHAYAGRLVSEHGLRLGYEPGARLLSEASCWQLAQEVVEAYPGPLDAISSAAGRAVPAVSTVVEAVLSLTGQLAEHLGTPEDLAEHLGILLAAWDALPDGEGRKTPLKPVLEAIGVLRQRQALAPLVLDYQRIKRARESLDFADQMSLAARIASAFPDVGRGERQRFRAVLLDEFQDTSEAQLVLLRRLYAEADETVPVMAVGDPHQSIYGWRGASSTTLTSFPQQFPGPAGPARTLPLSTSWRNDGAILAAANVIAAPLTAACPVEVAVLEPRPGAGPGQVEAARLDTLEAEAAHIADWLSERLAAQPDPSETGTSGTTGTTGTSTVAQHGDPRPTAAVLCRKRSQFTLLAETLTAAGLPVEVVGLGGLLSMPEVVDLVSFLHVVDDPSRGDHLMRLLTGPLVRLGPADLAGLHAWARSLGRGGEAGEPEQVGLVEALDRLPPTGWHDAHGRALGDTGRSRLVDLRRRVRRVRELLSATVPEVVGEAERVLGLDLELMARPGRSVADARVHLEAFADVVAAYASSSERPTLGGLLTWLHVAEARERGLAAGQTAPTPGAVQLLTVHASKGLEWDLVVVPGLEEGTFPAHESRVAARDDGGWRVPPPKDKAWLSGLDSLPFGLRGDRSGLPHLDWATCPDRQELASRIEAFVLACGQHAVVEERRLAYVAVTRARHELLLTAPVWATQRTPRVTSRLLDEVREAGIARTTAWAEMPDSRDDDLANPRLADQLTLPWPLRDAPDPALTRAAEAVQAARGSTAPTSKVAPAAAATPAVEPADDWRDLDREIAVLVAEREAAQQRSEVLVSLPAHLSTSSLVALADDPDEFAVGLRRPMPAAPATAARRGTAFHAWVEQHYAQAAIIDLDELPGSADESAADQGDVDLMKAHFLESEWAALSPVAIELAVESTVAGASLRGRIDAVFPRSDGGFTVVDWKTGAPPTGRRAEVRRLQLAVYRLAYARLQQVDPALVDGAFYYAATGQTVRPDLPDEQALATLVADLTAGQSPR